MNCKHRLFCGVDLALALPVIHHEQKSVLQARKLLILRVDKSGENDQNGLEYCNFIAGVFSGQYCACRAELKK
jgi:hypothetical protein